MSKEEAKKWLAIALEAERLERTSVRPKPEFEVGDQVVWTHTHDRRSENNGRYSANVIFSPVGNIVNVGIEITGRVDGRGMYEFVVGSRIQVPPTELTKTRQ